MKEKFTLWPMLFLQYLKRDWKKIFIWVTSLTLFSSGFVPAFEEITKGQGLPAMYETMQNPAMIAMVGPTPVHNAKAYTLGAMYTNEMLLFCGLFALILSILHVVSHTRKEEEHGLSELIRSFPVGRQANSLAVIVEIFLINVILAVSIALLMNSFDAASIDLQGSFLFGASIGLAGIIGGVLGLFFAQLLPTASGATGTALSFAGFLYLLRAGTDTTNLDYSMFNPLGWTYLTFPFTKNEWNPLIIGIIFTVILTIAAFLLEGHRDYNTGYLPEKIGPAHAKNSLLSVSGWYYRLNRGVIIGWLIAFCCLGAAYGSIYGDMEAFLESNSLMKEMFIRSGSSIEASFTGTIMPVMMGMTTILPITVVNRLGTEEHRMHLSQLLSTKVSRSQLYWTAVILGGICGLAGTLLSAGSLGTSALSVMVNSKLEIRDFLAAGLNFFPIILFFISLASLALGFFPSIGKLIYLYLTYSFMLSYFGGILDLPKWFIKTAAMNWLPHMPIEHFDAQKFVGILLVSLLLMIIGGVGYKHRDLHEGA